VKYKQKLVKKFMYTFLTTYHQLHLVI